MDYSIFGPLSVRAAPEEPPIDLAEKPALVLTRLLIEPGTAIAAGTLATDVWGERAADLKNVDNSVQRVVAQLRARLGDTAEPRRIIVLSGASSYRLFADPMTIDTERFKLLARWGHELLTRHPQAARAMLEDALGSWTGAPLAEQNELRWVTAFAAELEATRNAVEIDHNEVLLTLREYSRLESRLRRQIAEHPSDERRRAQLIRLLHATDREAEAGVAYRDAVRELGVPGTELRELGSRIVRGDRKAQAPVRHGRGGRSDRVLLHALIERRPRRVGQPGLGLAALLVVMNEGELQVVRGREVVAAFDTAESAAVAAKALAGNPHLHCAVGVHTGRSVYISGHLLGAAPDRCRLLAEAARHGQVVVSAAAHDRHWSGAGFLDLGEQRYEDLLPGSSVFELWADRPTDPTEAPATIDRRPHNLPVLETRFVGRESEMKEISRAIASGELISLVGAGGCGKTRLALQLAARAIWDFPDGSWFASLAELPPDSDAESIAVAILGQLGIRTLPEHPAPHDLIRHFSDRTALLVVDNCEHVLEGCNEMLAALRAACPHMCVLATTRRPLRVDSEIVFEVPAMMVDAGAEVDGLPDAVELLLERAGSLPDLTWGSHDTVTDAIRLCTALDGAPLAIELAAGQVARAGVAGVAVEVDAMLSGERGLGLLTSRDPRRAPRQRNIEATIRWSHDLMSPDEQLVLRRLSVFGGSFGMAEAQGVASDERLSPRAVAELVAALVDWSMVATEPPLAGTSRLRLKQAIRAFAIAELNASGEQDRVRARHADVYRTRASEVAPTLFGPGEQHGLALLGADYDNFRAALSYLVEGRLSGKALELAGALWWLWFSHGHFQEGSEWVARVLALDAAPSRERVRLLRAGSHLTWWRGAYAQSDRYNHELEECAARIDDAWGLAWAPMGHGAVLMFSDPAAALPYFVTSRQRFGAIGREWEAGYAQQLIAISFWFLGREPESLEAYEEAMLIYERIGHGSVLASVKRGAGMLAALCGDPPRGRALCLEALGLSTSMGDRQGAAQALNFLGAITRDEGTLEVAVGRYVDALSRAREVGDLWATCTAIDGVAEIARLHGEYMLAARLYACSDQQAAKAGYERPPHERMRRLAEDRRLRAVLAKNDLDIANAEGTMMAVADALASSIEFAARAA